MESWNVITTQEPGSYILLNQSRTLVKLSRRVHADVTELMSRMEEAGVPFKYSEGLQEIYFTILTDSTHGDYSDGMIRLSCSSDSKNIFDRILIHELAHYIDELEDISDDDEVIREKRTRAKFLPDVYAKKNVGEYVAVGFEIYYFGTKEERQRMKKKNPKLFFLIRRLHRKYRSR